jgi:L-aminopeptidase/D-esterase-like protein
LRPGARNLITDVGGLRVGNAHDAAAGTGTTVLVADRPCVAAVSVMGGAPGTRETDLLAPDRLVQEVDAIVLSGGSVFGLDAASGVAEALRAAGRGYAVGPHRVPIVPAAILFDLDVGGPGARHDGLFHRLGIAALAAAGEAFSLGTAGAGTGATTQGLKGGLGSASAVLDNGITLGAIVAVNAVGSAVAGSEGRFWAAPWEMGDEFGRLGAVRTSDHDPAGEPLPGKAPGSATTIAIVATDAQLTQAGAQRLATAAQDGIARALVPAHTLLDGDLVFAAATGARVLADPVADAYRLGHAAAAVLARAIGRAIYMAEAAPGDMHPTWRNRFGYQR